jgi:hypothetical protein
MSVVCYVSWGGIREAGRAEDETRPTRTRACQRIDESGMTRSNVTTCTLPTAMMASNSAD